MTRPRILVAGPHGSGNHIVQELLRELNDFNGAKYTVDFFSLPYDPVFQHLIAAEAVIIPLRDAVETASSQERRQIGARSPDFTTYEAQVARGYEQAAALHAFHERSAVIWYHELRSSPVLAVQAAIIQTVFPNLSEFPPNFGHQVW